MQVLRQHYETPVVTGLSRRTLRWTVRVLRGRVGNDVSLRLAVYAIIGYDTQSGRSLREVFSSRTNLQDYYPFRVDTGLTHRQLHSCLTRGEFLRLTHIH